MAQDKTITTDEQLLQPEVPVETAEQVEQEINKEDWAAKLEAAQKEIEDWKDKYLRLTAEFDNFRKRTRQEKEDIRKFANEEFIKALLPSLDDLGRGIQVIEKSEDIQSIKEGIALIEKNLWHQLQKQGVETIQSIGIPFNSDFHEAIATVPAEDGTVQGTIIEEIEKGYLYQGKVIRYSKVIIAE